VGEDPRRVCEERWAIHASEELVADLACIAMELLLPVQANLFHPAHP
jgi:hypothetical protein